VADVRCTDIYTETAPSTACRCLRTSGTGTSFNVGFFRFTLLRMVFVRCVCSAGRGGGCEAPAKGRQFQSTWLTENARGQPKGGHHQGKRRSAQRHRALGSREAVRRSRRPTAVALSSGALVDTPHLWVLRVRIHAVGATAVGWHLAWSRALLGVQVLWCAFASCAVPVSVPRMWTRKTRGVEAQALAGACGPTRGCQLPEEMALSSLRAPTPRSHAPAGSTASASTVSVHMPGAAAADAAAAPRNGRLPGSQVQTRRSPSSRALTHAQGV